MCDVSEQLQEHRFHGSVSASVSMASMAERPASVQSMFCALMQPATDDKVAAMAVELADVRRNVRAVQKQTCKSSLPWRPWHSVKFEAALVYELSQETKWAIVYVKMRQRQNMHRSTRMMPQTTNSMILDWWTQCRLTAAFANARSDINNKSRRKVDVFWWNQRCSNTCCASLSGSCWCLQQSSWPGA